MANNQFTFKTVEDRFLSKVSPEPMSGCWLWTESLNDDGYGTFTTTSDGVQLTEKAHRVSYCIFVGTVPDGLELDHLCRVRCCVNPKHLEPVTHKINMERGVSGLVSAARQRAKTHCPHGHEYTPENTRTHGASRYCSTCANRSTGVGKGFRNKSKTSCKRGHLFSPENTRIWRGARYCRACERQRHAKARS